jgi:3-hydroxy-9,10-secoandrosta-1,3,5(10)-triene-9,17-dione monooxygenase
VLDSAWVGALVFVGAAGAKMAGREELLAAARALTPALRDRARDTELLRRIPDETIRDLHAAGLFKVLQPACFGGYEADLATYFDLVLTLSEADGSVGWVYSVLMVQTWALSLMDPLASKEVWGADPSALLSSAVALRSGSIEKVADGYRIDARFGFSSGCHHASWIFILGVAHNAVEEGLTGFLVPRSDCEIVDNWEVMGLCGTGSCDVVVDSTVPTHRTHAVAKTGSQLSDAAIYNLPFMVVFPHAATVPIVGIAQGALDTYVASQKDRVRIIGGNVASEPSSQIRVAESAADLDAARLTLFRTAADVTEVASRDDALPPDLLARVDRDQVLAIRYAVTAVDRVFANAGARALSLDNPIQRAFRDAHAGAAHPAAQPEPRLAAYGALAFGVTPSPAH